MFRSSVAILLVGVGILISIFLMMVLFDHRFHNRSEDSDSIDHLKRKLIIKDSMDYQTNRFRQLEPISCKELINQGSKCGAVLVIMPRCDGYWAVNKRSKNIFNYLMIKDNSHLSGQVYSNPDVIFFCPNSTRDWRTNAAIMNNIRFEPLPFPLSEAHLNRFWFVDFLRVVGNYDWVLRLDADVELMSDGTASITDLISKSESGRDLPLLSSIAWRDYSFYDKDRFDAVSLIANYTKTHMCHYGFTAPVLSAVLINVQRYREIVSTTISYRQGVAKKVSIERFIAKVKQEYGNEYWSPEILWGGLHSLPIMSVGGFLNFSMKIGSVVYDSSNNSMDTLDMLKMYSLWSHLRKHRLAVAPFTYVKGMLTHICK